MWSFILRGFAPSNPKDVCDLTPLREQRFMAPDLSAAKRRLSELIANEVLPANTFYRFEGSGNESSLTIAFYLFEDRRICPLRIWNRTELFGKLSPGPSWMVDFNGLPPWSAISAVEPQWRLLSSLPENNRTIGRSARDWRKRNCWICKCD